MRIRGAENLFRDSVRRGSEQGRGLTRTLIRTTAANFLESGVPDPSKQPCLLVEAVSVQNEDGSFPFLVGYSAVGGPDTIG
jgi:hypothetical protein